MKLNLNERFAIMDLLPKKGDFVMIKQYRNLKEKLALQPEEVKSFKVKVNGDNMSWDKSLDIGVDLEFKEVEVDIIKKELIMLDSKKLLEDKHFSIYTKFMEGE